jgi:hypothetical protein
MSALNLSTLLVSSKETEVEYPGYPGFKVNLCFLSREELVKIRKKATKITWKNRQQSEELNEDLFLSLYVQSTVKGWSGLKLSILQKLAPVDLKAQKDLEATLDYTEDNALYLMKSSTEFDSFVSEQVSDLANFQ